MHKMYGDLLFRTKVTGRKGIKWLERSTPHKQDYYRELSIQKEKCDLDWLQKSVS